jgi:hypothetical protein
MARRFDGRPAPGVPPYRRIIPFLMRGKNEASVYFEKRVDLSRTLPWLAERSHLAGRRLTVFPLLLHVLAQILHERPRLNRFVSGRRIHQRDGVYLSFAAKKRFDDDAPLAVVKRRFDAGESFDALCASLGEAVTEARSDRPSAVDRELGVLLRLPAPVLEGAVRLLRSLDFFGMAPRALLEHDPMYTSVFVANLGSIGLDAAYHHLYEYGNCPLFVTVGKVERAPVVTDAGAIEARDTVQLKFTYDERIEDGLYCARSLELLQARIEDPARWLDRPGTPAGE